MPIWRSALWIRRLAPSTRSLDWTSFSTAKTTPSLTRRPIAVLCMCVCWISTERNLHDVGTIIFTHCYPQLCLHIQLGKRVHQESKLKQINRTEGTSINGVNDRSIESVSILLCFLFFFFNLILTPVPIEVILLNFNEEKKVYSYLRTSLSRTRPRVRQNSVSTRRSGSLVSYIRHSASVSNNVS